ncbi:MAG TPA: 3-hydroxyacyl-CoA dehydrogenase NAD-binding domain-containing protein, partial [Nitrolancea sp.]|nr:3-hydroxyacyl-CoA dehydrogenase NAD-binding domain-containing protein [Nitrolancea sp.]
MTENQNETVAVVGVGTMGWQIALQLAAHGTPIRLYDRDPSVVSLALQRIREQGPSLAAERLLPQRADDLSD